MMRQWQTLQIRKEIQITVTWSNRVKNFRNFGRTTLVYLLNLFNIIVFNCLLRCYTINIRGSPDEFRWFSLSEKYNNQTDKTAEWTLTQSFWRQKRKNRNTDMQGFWSMDHNRKNDSNFSAHLRGHMYDTEIFKNLLFGRPLRHFKKFINWIKSPNRDLMKEFVQRFDYPQILDLS